MAIFTNIQIALDSRLNTLTDKPDIAWPNVKYRPSKGTAFLRPTLLPAASSRYTLNNGDMHQGIYQVDIFVPLDVGLATVLDYADDIRSHFRDQTLTAGGDKIYINYVSLGNYERVDSWFRVIVEINYMSIEE